MMPRLAARALSRVLAFALAFALALALAALIFAAPVAAAAPPNILIILADDLGWRDVSYHESEIRTPEIDRIAREGIELDRFYVQPTCSPTRSGLMTGKSPLRLGITTPISKNQETGLPLDERILPQYLADAGYQSLMVGKWHLGHHTPDQFPHARGFESFYGHVTGGVGYWDHNHGGGHDWQRNGETLREGGYTTTLIADEAIRVLKARDTQRPTFLYVAFNAPHLPNEAPHEAISRYPEIQDPKRRLHAAMVSELDAAVGRVVAAFEAEGLLENTIVLFSSDNGGLNKSAYPQGMKTVVTALTNVFGRPQPLDGLEFLAANVQDGASRNFPLSRGKGSVREGGVRVPAAIWWPGRLAGLKHEGFMSISDVLPTLLEAAGAEAMIPDDLDGASQLGALRDEPDGEAAASDTPDYAVAGLEGVALFRAPWKLVNLDAPELYQIYDDPKEKRNLAAANPEIVRALVAAAEKFPAPAPVGGKIVRTLLDPDRFGGPEDRAPWAEAARDRALGVAPAIP
ncbi:MAG: arylsulfatase [Myxococcota bacterium]